MEEASNDAHTAEEASNDAFSISVYSSKYSRAEEASNEGFERCAHSMHLVVAVDVEAGHVCYAD